MISCVVSMFMVLGMSSIAFASDEAINPYVPNAMIVSEDGASQRTAYDEAERLFDSGDQWTSYQYYCDGGDYFGGYSKYNQPSGD